MRPARRALGAVAAFLLLLAACGSGPGPPRPAFADPVEQRVLAELDAYVGWLDDHGVDGYVGEVGWPAGPEHDTERWNAIGAAWLEAAREAGLWVTVWGAGSWWGDDYALSPYVASDGRTIDTPAPQAAVIERHTGDPPLGVNVSGAEFGAPPGAETRSTFSNERPGEPGTDYAYEGAASFDYLASRGLTLVRLPVRWERLQRVPGGPLDAAEVARLRATVTHAGEAGLGVVLDVHNYGGYFLDCGGEGVRQPIGSPAVPISAFADLWRRLSREFAGDEAVVAYGLMNEPHGLDASPEASARRWEEASRAAVDAIRATGDGTLVMVPGANWSNVRGWAEVHPEPWIDHASGPVRYEAHHYFDDQQSGDYGGGLSPSEPPGG